MLETKVFHTMQGEDIVYYDNEAKKEALLLIHGNLGSHLLWEEIIEELKEDYRIIAPTMRGFGDSSYHRPIANLEDLARDLLELIEDLELSAVHVLGWSLGGAIAMELAYLLGDKAKSLILSAAVPAEGYHMYHFDPKTLRFDFSKELKTKAEVAKSPYYLPQKRMIEERDLSMMTKVVTKLFAKSKAPESFLQHFLESIPKQRNLLEVLYGVICFDITKNGRIEAFQDLPLLVLHGEKDHLILEEAARKSAAQFPKAKYCLFPGAEHALHLDVKKAWMQEIMAFLESFC